MKLAVIVDACVTGDVGESLLTAELGGISVLRRVIERCARVPGIEALICVMSDANSADALAAEAEQCDALVVRGDARDALGLCAQGASECGADTIIRIAANQPFFDPALGARVLALMSDADADFSCNDLPASWPEGLDCEVFSARLLHWADALADHPEHRAKVTSWMRANSDLKKACLTGPGGDFAHMRWALGWPEDLAFAQAVFAQMGERAASASAAEIASFCMRRPDVAKLNGERNNAVRLKAKWRADIETPPMSLSVVA
jgi:spore coat polysaccharide biosynthesis protein SpsF (cytidylyltransferase family)